MRAKSRKPLAVLITSLFLAAHVVCVCAGSAHAAMSTLTAAHAAAADPHACCHRHDPHAPARTPARPCLHCSPSVVAAPESPKLAAPFASPVPAFSLTAAPVLPAAPASRAVAWSRHGGHAPPADRVATVVLRL